MKIPPGLIPWRQSQSGKTHRSCCSSLKDCVGVHQKLSVKYGGIVGTSSNTGAKPSYYLPKLSSGYKEMTFRGNVPTRVHKLHDENYDAIMLAKAGVTRLGLDLSEFYVEELSPTELIPAPAQGALAIQIRESNTELLNALQTLNHPNVAEELAVERTVLKLFGGGCHLPLGCYCRKDEDKYQVFTSKADEGDEFPDRLFIEAESTEGLAEKVVSYFDSDGEVPSKSIHIARTFRRQLFPQGSRKTQC